MWQGHIAEGLQSLSPPSLLTCGFPVAQEKLKACLGTLESNLTSTTEKQEHQEENKVKLEVWLWSHRYT